jgi:hypothetical protein
MWRSGAGQLGAEGLVLLRECIFHRSTQIMGRNVGEGAAHKGCGDWHWWDRSKLFVSLLYLKAVSLLLPDVECDQDLLGVGCPSTLQQSVCSAIDFSPSTLTGRRHNGHWQ